MNIVLDTNVLIVSISRQSVYRNIFDSFLNEAYVLCVTNDILFEYEEIIAELMSKEVASNILQLIENATNVLYITKYFKWNLINADPDDNKFVDCAVASEAKFLVSNDKHFNILKQVDFPKVELITVGEFNRKIE